MRLIGSQNVNEKEGVERKMGCHNFHLSEAKGIENRILRQIFEPKRDVNGKWK